MKQLADLLRRDAPTVSGVSQSVTADQAEVWNPDVIASRPVSNR